MKNHLRVLRAERRWSQADLAERLAVSRQTVNAIENDKYDPSLPLAFRVDPRGRGSRRAGTLRGAWKAGMYAAQARPNFSAKPMRCSLPVGPLGISSRNTMRRGTLKSTRRPAAKRRSSLLLTDDP